MPTPDLTELRRWAAEVCGLTFVPGAKGDLIDRTFWLPDQNIAQAFEVLDAVRATMPHVAYRLEQTTYEQAPHVGPHECLVGDAEAFHESRCMAILLACHAAHKAVK